MPKPLRHHGYTATEIHEKIHLLINNLINIKDTTGEFLMPLTDGRIIDTKGWNDWEWTHGIGLYGLYQYHSLTSSGPTLEIINKWFSNRLAEGTTKNINTMAVMLTLAHLYQDTHDQRYLPWLEEWAEWCMHDIPRTKHGGFQHITYLDENENQLWDDTLMMAVLPLAKIGRVLGRPQYVEEAKRQFLLHVQYLFDRDTGLWFHGWKFDDSNGNPGAAVGHNFARARWARGNSWITIAIPDFIELLDLPPTDSLRVHLLDTLEAQCSALKACQRDSGLWSTLLDEPESNGSYVEASASAGFAYGMLKAVRKRYVDREKYEGVAIKAVRAVIGEISADGELENTSFGTAIGWDLQHYKDIPITSMPYGQAMAIMMLGEFLKVFI